MILFGFCSYFLKNPPPPTSKENTLTHKHKMWRTIDAITITTSSLLSSHSNPSVHCSLVTTNQKPHHTLCLAPKTLILCTIFATTTTATDSISSLASLTVVRCVSSFFPTVSLDWNKPVRCSEVGKGNGDNDNLDEDNKPCIPVGASSLLGLHFDLLLGTFLKVFNFVCEMKPSIVL